MAYESVHHYSTTTYSDQHHGLTHIFIQLAKHLDAGVLLALALLAFEIFNFSATRYALSDLLGNISFISVRWATILAIAFCAIDVAGLLRFFSLGGSGDTLIEAWYLMGAWLLGATMNALMAWWAVSVTLLNHPPSSPFLSQLPFLDHLPLLVAILIWLVRLLFIGAFGLTAGDFFSSANSGRH